MPGLSLSLSRFDYRHAGSLPLPLSLRPPACRVSPSLSRFDHRHAEVPQRAGPVAPAQLRRLGPPFSRRSPGALGGRAGCLPAGSRGGITRGLTEHGSRPRPGKVASASRITADHGGSRRITADHGGITRLACRITAARVTSRKPPMPSARWPSYLGPGDAVSCRVSCAPPPPRRPGSEAVRVPAPMGVVVPSEAAFREECSSRYLPSAARRRPGAASASASPRSSALFARRRGDHARSPTLTASPPLTAPLRLVQVPSNLAPRRAHWVNLYRPRRELPSTHTAKACCSHLCFLGGRCEPLRRKTRTCVWPKV